MRKSAHLRGSIVLASLLPLSVNAWAASYPPHYRFRTLHTERAAIHFHQGLEDMARQAARLVPEILARHEARYHARLPRLDIVLSDQDDDPNGFTWVFPYPLIQIRAASPDGSDILGNYEDWLRFVLTHEIAHAVHMEPARRVPGAARKILGRAVFLFPNAATPTWLIEGLATYEETEATAFGRGRDPDSRMVVRMATLAGGPPPEDLAAVIPDRWPGGQTPYLMGESFIRDIQARFGRQTLPDLTRVQSGCLIPFTDDLTAAKVTGGSFHARWGEWSAAARVNFDDEAVGIVKRGETPARALTHRGIAQVGPRVSPNGSWVAYTSSTLTGYRAIRMVRPDGTEDRKLADRNGGHGLTWTPDGRGLIFDEPESHDLFESRSDLRMMEVATGRVRTLTRGLRARDPDLSPDGRRVVFVRRFSDRSELSLLDLGTEAVRNLTTSISGTQWSGPRFSPDGRTIVASRWSDAGFLDLMRVDPQDGQTRSLTSDRAKDVEPTWSPDGRYVVFRSDRDGVSNLYSLRLADGMISRVTNVLGGAFMPSVFPDGRSIAYADYRAEGYDIRLTEVDLDGLPAAAAFVDRNPLPHPPAQPVDAADSPYRPLSMLLPRWWSPTVAVTSEEWRWGATTGGSDPLNRHLWGANVDWGTATRHLNAKAYYVYDRFRPTFTVSAREESSFQDEDIMHTREVGISASMPLTRSFRHDQSLALSWRFRRDSITQLSETKDLGGLELAWSLGGTRQYGYSISPVEGWRLRLGFLREDPALGSDVALSKAAADFKTYTRVFGETDALAVRFSGGTTFGAPGSPDTFSVGGFPDSGLLDVVGTNMSLLRGYPTSAFAGRHFANLNAEYRVPLAHPQRGFRSLPLFIRHLHAASFFDAGHAWRGDFHWGDVKTSAGAALGADIILGHALPMTVTVGVAHGFAAKGDTLTYFRTGLAF